MNTDPIADMLTRIRNALAAKHERARIPFSNLKAGLAEILKREGYVWDSRVIPGPTPGQGMIEVKLKYDTKDGSPIIGELRRASKPGLRVYLGWKDIPNVRRGLGTMVLTTSRGLMTDRDARAAKVGGEPLCTVW